MVGSVVMIKIINNQKVEITEDEYKLYQEICKAYEEYGGSKIFEDLFETNEEGLIQFVRPPVRQTSMEVIVFVMALQQQQHIRNMYKILNEALGKIK